MPSNEWSRSDPWATAGQEVVGCFPIEDQLTSELWRNPNRPDRQLRATAASILRLLDSLADVFGADGRV